MQRLSIFSFFFFNLLNLLSASKQKIQEVCAERRGSEKKKNKVGKD